MIHSKRRSSATPAPIISAAHDQRAEHAPEEQPVLLLGGEPNEVKIRTKMKMLSRLSAYSIR